MQVAALEACEKEKKKAEDQIEDLVKKLAKFEEDTTVGAQVCSIVCPNNICIYIYIYCHWRR